MSGELRTGWRIIVAGALGLMFTVTHIYTLGVMLKPLEAEFGWGREQISFGTTIVSILVIPMAPLVGFAIDRFGFRRIVLPGVVLLALSLALLAGTGDDVTDWYWRWILLGFSYSFLNITWVVGIARNFERRRGIAISFCLMGTGLAAILIPWVTANLIVEFGWRIGYLAMAAWGLAVVFPLAWLWFADRPDSTAGSAARLRPSDPNATLPGVDRAAIFRSRIYWQLAAICFLAMATIIGATVHMVAILNDNGIEYRTAAAVAGLVGVGNIVGRLLGGYLLDRIHGSLVGAFAFMCPIAAAALLLAEMEQSLVMAGLIAFLIGLANGTESDVVSYVTSRYFGLRNFGLAFSSLGAFIAVGVGVGPLLAGAIFDRTGSYQLFLQVSVVALLLCILLIATLGPYPEDAGSAAELDPQHA